MRSNRLVCSLTTSISYSWNTISLLAGRTVAGRTALLPGGYNDRARWAACLACAHGVAGRVACRYGDYIMHCSCARARRCISGPRPATFVLEMAQLAHARACCSANQFKCYLEHRRCCRRPSYVAEDLNRHFTATPSNMFFDGLEILRLCTRPGPPGSNLHIVSDVRQPPQRVWWSDPDSGFLRPTLQRPHGLASSPQCSPLNK
jgi:hypothetical protein